MAVNQAVASGAESGWTTAQYLLAVCRGSHALLVTYWVPMALVALLFSPLAHGVWLLSRLAK